MTFHDDLGRAADWVDAYLERVADLPGGGRRSQPGEIRARLPDSPPEQGEPFDALLRDLDEVILPGLTHWNHPRFFAWFANHRLRAGDPRRAADRGAERQRDDVARVAGGDRARADGDGLARPAPRPAAPAGTGTSRTPRRRRRSPRSPRRARCARAASSTRRSRRTSASRRRRGSSGSSTARSRSTTTFRMRADFPLDDATAVVATVGHDRHDVGRSGARARRPLRRGRRVAPRRRGLRRRPRRSAPSCAGASTASIVPTRSSSIRTSGCSRRWTARRSGRGGPRCSTRRSRLAPRLPRPATEEAVDLKDYGPALGRRFRALKLWTVLRCYGAEGLRALIREHVRLAQLFASWVEAEPGLGGRRAASVLDRLLPARRRRQLRARARGDRDRRALRRGDDACADRTRSASRSATRARPRTTFAAPGRCFASARGDLRPLGDADRLGRGGGRGACRERIDELVGPGFRERWYAAPNRYTAPVRTVLAEVGVPAAVDGGRSATIRLDYVRACLVPRPGAVETLRDVARPWLPHRADHRLQRGRRDAVAASRSSPACSTPRSSRHGSASRSPTRGSTCTAASCSASSRTTPSSSATARTTSSTARAVSGWTRSSSTGSARIRCGPRWPTGTARA